MWGPMTLNSSKTQKKLQENKQTKTTTKRERERDAEEKPEPRCDRVLSPIIPKRKDDLWKYLFLQGISGAKPMGPPKKPFLQCFPWTRQTQTETSCKEKWSRASITVNPSHRMCKNANTILIVFLDVQKPARKHNFWNHRILKKQNETHKTPTVPLGTSPLEIPIFPAFPSWNSENTMFIVF